jgi:hypothetical protein
MLIGVQWSARGESLRYISSMGDLPVFSFGRRSAIEIEVVFEDVVVVVEPPP